MISKIQNTNFCDFATLRLIEMKEIYFTDHHEPKHLLSKNLTGSLLFSPSTIHVFPA